MARHSPPATGDPLYGLTVSTLLSALTGAYNAICLVVTIAGILADGWIV
jgi:hypothetical protein